MRGFSGSNKGDDRWRYGSKDGIKQKLVLSHPDVIGGIRSGDVAGCDCCGWTWVLTVDEAHEVEANQECMKLKFP